MPTRRHIWGFGEKTVKWVFTGTGAVALGAILTLFTLKDRFLPNSAEPKYFSLKIQQHSPDPLDTEFIFTNIADYTLKDVEVIPKHTEQFCSLSPPLASTSLPKLPDDYLKKMDRSKNLGNVRPQETAVLKLIDPVQHISRLLWINGQLCLQASFKTNSGKEEHQDFGAYFAKEDKINYWIPRPSSCDDVFHNLETPPETPPELERICDELANSLQKSSQ